MRHRDGPYLPLLAQERHARRLREACARRKAAWLAGLVGTRQKVLVERADGMGHAENFAPVRVAPPLGGGRPPGQIVEVRVTAVEGEVLIGVPA